MILERTLVLIKPDGVERKLIGEIISFYERKGIDIAAFTIVHAHKDIAKKHYEEHKGRPYFEELITYITQGKLCAMVLEGENVIEIVRKINGDKDPLKSELGTIRGRFAVDKTHNLVHASDCSISAEREIGIWFPDFNL
jgi:nucleoside-diphosphate kinase